MSNKYYLLTYLLHLLHLKTFLVICVTVNNKYSQCPGSSAGRDTSAPLVMQWHRQLLKVPLQPTHE